VVGGLTFDSKDKTIERVPLLGQIPLIGLAFQSQSRMKSARTVYVFITPRILRDESFADLRLLTRGTMEDVNVARDTPELLPAIMPVRASISSPSEGAL
jgi:type II secretory pathway component GspD/PulD (secretin)